MWWRWQQKALAGRRPISTIRRTEETARPALAPPKAGRLESRSAKAQSPAPRSKRRLPSVARRENRLSGTRPHRQRALLSLSVNGRSDVESEHGIVFVRGG